jgi:SAM-dependent methyltransferase
MSFVYPTAKWLFRRVLPQPAQDWIWSRRNPLAPLLVRVKLSMEKRAEHDEVYDAAYYEKVDEGMTRSAAVIARHVVQEFRPKTVIDIGCGTGALLAALRDQGVLGVGFEHSRAALAFCQSRGLDVRHFDVESATPLGALADVAISTEVAEHLPEAFADRFVALLCGAAPIVVVTAAIPGQGGTDHVNEQPNSYWVQKFEAAGFTLDESMTNAWRSSWRAQGTEDCYSANVMTFARRMAKTGAGAA